jgi:osmotically-inducible protein OsmY
MKTDIELRRDVVAELNWEPSIRDEDIAVAVKGGVVTLAGTVDTYAQRYAAERSVERIHGVKAVVNDLAVKLTAGIIRSDPEIAHAALTALEWDVQVPQEGIKVRVANGHVTLDGEVQWQYQRQAADRAVRNLAGVKGVTNLIRVLEAATLKDVREHIQDALRRQAEADANQLTVEVTGHVVRLQGTVRTVAEKRRVENAAWRARGVTRVENMLTVDPLLPALA